MMVDAGWFVHLSVVMVGWFYDVMVGLMLADVGCLISLNAREVNTKGS